MKKQYIIATVIFAFVFFIIANARISKAIIESEREFYISEIDSLKIRNVNYFLEIEHLKSTLKHYGIKVTVTMYEPTRGQTDRTPHITADGSSFDIESASTYRWIALSRNLIKRYNNNAPFKYGDWVYVSNAGHKDGMYQVKDTMNKRYKNTADILESVGTTPYKFTHAKLTKVVWSM